MTASRIAWYLAIASAAVWTFKALAIWEAGGLGRTDLEDLGWAGGMILFLTTWAMLGYSFAGGRAVWLRIVAGVAGVVVGLVVVLVLDGAAEVLPESTGWVKEEAGLWAAALATLAVAWWGRLRSGEHRP